MRELPWGARAGVLGAALAACLCAAPALCHPEAVDWTVVVPLALLCALCEWLPRCPLLGRPAPAGASRMSGALSPGWICPVLLAAALLVTPAAAALVPIPGALIGRAEPPATARRIWRAALGALAVWAAAGTHRLFAGADGPAGAPVALPGALLPAGAAVLAFCLVLAAADGLMLVLAEGRSVRTAWGGRLGSLVAPHLVHGVGGVLMAVLWRGPYGPPAALFVLLPMCLCTWVFTLYHREHAAHQATVRALVQAVDIKDRYTRGHSERVGRASALIGRELGLADERVEALRFAGILHDVGKLGVPTRVLRKEGPLTEEERRVVQLHPEYGHEMVRGIRFLGDARAAILHHHERLDGSGYPHGLSGGRIPQSARVVAVADAFDAMTSHRSYRRGRPVPAAVAELWRCAGTQFDPLMVGALARALERYGWSPAATVDALPGPPAAPAGGKTSPLGAVPVLREPTEERQPGVDDVPEPVRDAPPDAPRPRRSPAASSGSPPREHGAHDPVAPRWPAAPVHPGPGGVPEPAREPSERP